MQSHPQHTSSAAFRQWAAPAEVTCALQRSSQDISARVSGIEGTFRKKVLYLALSLSHLFPFLVSSVFFNFLTSVWRHRNPTSTLLIRLLLALLSVGLVACKLDRSELGYLEALAARLEQHEEFKAVSPCSLHYLRFISFIWFGLSI